jgi:predicted AAA+ superfamily ATPase
MQKRKDHMAPMIRRARYRSEVETALAENPVRTWLGPRQCGKTTLAGEVADTHGAHSFDLETASARAQMENPELALSPLRGLVVIDEIPRIPELFAALRLH